MELGLAPSCPSGMAGMPDSMSCGPWGASLGDSCTVNIRQISLQQHQATKPQDEIGGPQEPVCCVGLILCSICSLMHLQSDASSCWTTIGLHDKHNHLHDLLPFETCMKFQGIR